MGRFITMWEVSQKQAYIFSSNKLRDNIINSAVIADVLSPEYIKKVLTDCGYKDEENMVYAGGGHTILSFGTKDMAVKCTAVITRRIYEKFDGLTVFSKTIEYDENKSLGENIEKLTEELEKKKALRLAAFHKGSFGIEDRSNTLNAVSDDKEQVSRKEDDDVKKLFENQTLNKYVPAYKFEDLGGNKGESNFIAVVHIDGNGMGKRVEEINKTIKNDSFESACKIMRAFSEAIDEDYKAAFKEMLEEVSKQFETKNSKVKETVTLKGQENRKYFPVRKIITAGDDICFVTEGRLGIECAVSFIKALNLKTNKVDNKGYSASAGVAIVHQKYPFYKAYELSELLCSNAKKFNATVHPDDNGQAINSIDWHVEFGELSDTIEDLRKRYIADDGSYMNMRPYIINANKTDVTSDIMVYHSYERFKDMFKKITSKSDSLASGKLKELRGRIKQGKESTAFYLNANLMTSIIDIENEYVMDGVRKTETSVHFDIIEMMDSYIPFE